MEPAAARPVAGVAVASARDRPAGYAGARRKISRPTAPAESPENSLLPLLQFGVQTRPVERGPRISLAPRRDIVVAADALRRQRRVSVQQLPRQLGQPGVLSIGIRQIIRPLQLHTQRKIVAVVSPCDPGSPGMPGTFQAGDGLRQPAIMLDEEMRGNLQGRDLGEERMLMRGQAVLKERLHLAGTELPRW